MDNEKKRWVSRGPEPAYTRECNAGKALTGKNKIYGVNVSGGAAAARVDIYFDEVGISNIAFRVSVEANESKIVELPVPLKTDYGIYIASTQADSACIVFYKPWFEKDELA